MEPPHTVFVVQHVHELPDGTEDVKLVGVYSSLGHAEAAVARAAAQPGFRDASDGFHIDPYDLDVDHWPEGFVTLGTVDGMTESAPDPSRPAG
jgi:hypothetical protein